MHIWIVDVYLQKEHRGLRDVPARVWTAGTVDFKPELPRRPEDLNVLLGEAITRKVTKSGIEWEGLIYQDSSLALLRQRLEGQQATVKFDPNDIGAVYVLDPFTSSYVMVPAVDQTYTSGLSKWQHGVVRAFARRTVKGVVDVVSLIRAKANIQRIVEEEYHRTKKTGSKQKIARWLNPSTDNPPQAALSDNRPVRADANIVPAHGVEPDSDEIEIATWRGTADFIQLATGISTGKCESSHAIQDCSSESEPMCSVEGNIVTAEQLAERKNQKRNTANLKKSMSQAKLPEAVKSLPEPKFMPATSKSTDIDGEDLDTSGWGGSYFDVDQED